MTFPGGHVILYGSRYKTRSSKTTAHPAYNPREYSWRRGLPRIRRPGRLGVSALLVFASSWVRRRHQRRRGATVRNQGGTVELVVELELEGDLIVRPDRGVPVEVGRVDVEVALWVALTPLLLEGVPQPFEVVDSRVERQLARRRVGETERRVERRGQMARRRGGPIRACDRGPNPYVHTVAGATGDR